MVEEKEAKIRPIWLIGGGAAAVILGACALVSTCIAAGLIWFSTQTSGNDRQPTQVVAVRATATSASTTQPTVSVLTRSLPTPLPGIGTAVPAATSIGFFPTADSLRMPPDQAVRSYYQLVSAERYDLTWAMLTDAFKQKFNCCAPNYDITGYRDWWNSVDRVEFGAVNTVSQSGDRAVVYAEIFFVMNTGQRSGVDTNPYIELVYDAALGTWRFDDKRATA